MPEGIYRISECDRCGEQDKAPYDQQDASTRRPVGWDTVRIGSGEAKVLCPGCLEGVTKALQPLERKRKQS